MYSDRDKLYKGIYYDENWWKPDHDRLTKKTARNLKTPTEEIVRLFEDGVIKPGMKVMDYGAGFGRNAEYLRSKGVEVYAYDVNADRESDGWTSVSGTKPYKLFDVTYSSFVLNVVMKRIQDNILMEMNTMANTSYVIVGNEDILVTLNSMYKKKDEKLLSYMRCYSLKTLDQVARFGFFTTSGFQRLVRDEDMRFRGYDLLKKTKGYKFYKYTWPYL